MKILKLFAISVVLVLLFVGISNAQCKVGWNAYVDAARTSEFRLYIASTSMGSATAIKFSPTTLVTYTIPDSLLIPGAGVKSYIRITAYDSVNNMESPPSNEVIYTRPTTTTTSIPTTTTTSILPLVAPSNLQIVP